MVIAETGRNGVTVRIHDEYCASTPQASLEHISSIITGSYRRRNAETGQRPAKG